MPTPKMFLAPHLVEWFTDIYINTYGKDTTYTDIVLKFNNYFKQLVNNATFTTFSNIILTIGLCMMLLYFFTDLSSKAAMKQLSQLQMWKSFSVLIGTAFVIYNIKYIIIFMLNFVEGLGSIGTLNIGYNSVSNFLQSDIVQLMLCRCVGEHFSLWSIIGYTFAAFILTLVNLAVKGVIMYYAATRTIQLFVYYIFAPLGVADIFENGPGGTINFRSSGFKYLKTMLAIMLQVLVIGIVCNSYSLVTSAVNINYYTEQGDEDVTKIDLSTAAYYPLMKMKYTNHKAKLREIIGNGLSNIKEAVDTLSSFLNADDDDTGEVPEDTQAADEQKVLDDDEIFRVLDVVQANGTIKDEEEAEKIIDNDNYRTTIQSTEQFFDWCVGADGSKTVLFIILMITKALLVMSASKICNYIVGVSI